MQTQSAAKLQHFFQIKKFKRKKSKKSTFCYVKVAKTQSNDHSYDVITKGFEITSLRHYVISN